MPLTGSMPATTSAAAARLVARMNAPGGDSVPAAPQPCVPRCGAVKSVVHEATAASGSDNASAPQGAGARSRGGREEAAARRHGRERARAPRASQHSPHSNCGSHSVQGVQVCAFCAPSRTIEPPRPVHRGRNLGTVDAPLTPSASRATTQRGKCPRVSRATSRQAAPISAKIAQASSVRGSLPTRHA